MLRRVSFKILRVVAPFAVLAGAFAQERPFATTVPLFLKVDWVQPENQANTKVRYGVVQENIVDPNVEMKFYGPEAKKVLTNGTFGSATAPYGIWTGEAQGPFAITFKLKNNYVDMTGLSTVRWFTRTSGFHVVRPVVKLANGLLLVGDLAIASVAQLTLNEFSLGNIRWIKLDPDRVVTVNSGPPQNPNQEIWSPNPDLSKIEEIGFADLMPGSGHGTGGWIQLGTIEVYGKAVPKDGASGSH